MSTTFEDILSPGNGVTGGVGRPKTAAVPISGQMDDGTETRPVNVPQAETPAETPVQPAVEKPEEQPYWDWQAGEKTGGEPEPPEGQVPYARGMEPRKEEKRPGLSYTEMWQRLNPYTPPTAEEVEAERKKEKRQKLFAALGDGISALSNLYFTTKGAPSMYTGQQTQSQQVNDRWEKLRQERQANLKEYTEGLMKAQQLDDARWDADRTWKETMENNWRNYQLKKAADERAAETHDLEMQLAQGKISEQEFKTKKAEVDAKYAERVAKAKAEEAEAKAETAKTISKYAGKKEESIIFRNNAAGTASLTSAENNKTKSELNRANTEKVKKNADGSYTAYDSAGNPHTFRKKDEADNFARSQGTYRDVYHTDTETTTTGSKDHPRVKKTEKQRRVGGYRMTGEQVRRQNEQRRKQAEKQKQRPKQRQKPAAKPKPKPAVQKFSIQY